MTYNKADLFRFFTAKLDKEVAEAKTKQAEAEKALLEIQERLRQRGLTPEQKAQLLLKLKQCPVGKVEIVYPPNNLEAEKFAKQLQGILHEVGWASESSMQIPFLYDFQGLTVEVSSSENVIGKCLHRALTEVGFPAPGLINPDIPSESLNLIIGEKP